MDNIVSAVKKRIRDERRKRTADHVGDDFSEHRSQLSLERLPEASAVVVYSVPVNVREIVVSEHIGSEFCKIQDSVGSEDKGHNAVNQLVYLVRIERDVYVEHARRRKSDVNAAVEQFENVEVRKQFRKRAGLFGRISFRKRELLRSAFACRGNFVGAVCRRVYLIDKTLERISESGDKIQIDVYRHVIAQVDDERNIVLRKIYRHLACIIVEHEICQRLRIGR